MKICNNKKKVILFRLVKMKKDRKLDLNKILIIIYIRNQISFKNFFVVSKTIK